jgi:hypothetical protein
MLDRQLEFAVAANGIRQRQESTLAMVFGGVTVWKDRSACVRDSLTKV